MNIKKYLPSNNFIKKALYIALLVLIFILIQSVIYPKLKQAFNLKRIPKDATIQTLVDADSDADGVPNWEESIWGTDPNKKDSDNDGVSDFDFIQSKKMSLGELEVNETVLISRDVMQVLLAMIDNGVATDEAISELSKIASEGIIKPEITDTFDRSSLNIVSTNKSNSTAYYNSFRSAYNTFSNSKAPDEFLLLAVAISSESDEQFLDMDQTIQKYQNFLNSLARLKVPSEAVDAHLSFINSLSSIIASLEKSKELFSNSVIGVNGIAELRLSHTKLDQSTDQLGAFFRQQGLIN